jgi:hypothetical protein
LKRRGFDFITRHFEVLADYAGIATTLTFVVCLVASVLTVTHQITQLKARDNVQRVRQELVERDLKKLSTLVIHIHQELREIHPDNQKPRWFGPKKGSK